MAAAIDPDATISVLREEQHLAVPRVGIERPAVREGNYRAFAPVFVENLRTFFRRDIRHRHSPMLMFAKPCRAGGSEGCVSTLPAKSRGRSGRMACRL